MRARTMSGSAMIRCTALLLALSTGAWWLLPAKSARAVAPPGRYAIDTNGTPDDFTDDTVLDTKTNLRWQRLFSPLVTWDPAAGPGTAQGYCLGLTVGTYGAGWRLPTVKEVVTLVDPRSHPAFDNTVFPGIKLWIESGNTPRLWTSTPLVSSATTNDAGATVYTSAWVMGIGAGHTIPWTANLQNTARCVR
jgi:hypothetical protein